MKRSPTASSTISGASKKGSETSQKAPEASPKGPEASPKGPEASPKAPEGSQKAPEGSPKAPEGSQKAPEGSQKAPGISRKTKDPFGYDKFHLLADRMLKIKKLFLLSMESDNLLEEYLDSAVEDSALMLSVSTRVTKLMQAIDLKNRPKLLQDKAQLQKLVLLPLSTNIPTELDFYKYALGEMEATHGFSMIQYLTTNHALGKILLDNIELLEAIHDRFTMFLQAKMSPEASPESLEIKLSQIEEKFSSLSASFPDDEKFSSLSALFPDEVAEAAPKKGKLRGPFDSAEDWVKWLAEIDEKSPPYPSDDVTEEPKQDQKPSPAKKPLDSSRMETRGLKRKLFEIEEEEPAQASFLADRSSEKTAPPLKRLRSRLFEEKEEKEEKEEVKKEVKEEIKKEVKEEIKKEKSKEVMKEIMKEDRKEPKPIIPAFKRANTTLSQVDLKPAREEKPARLVRADATLNEEVVRKWLRSKGS
ncbi:MAG: hypothetical protein ACHQJ6_01495 [Candidatus Berkiellales bacterium]